MSSSTTLLVVIILISVVAVCGTGVGILVCCLAWMRRSESVWTKAELKEMKLLKRDQQRERKKGPQQVEAAKTKEELPQHRGLATRTARDSYDTPVNVVGNTVMNVSTDLGTSNSMVTARNEAYIKTPHQVHIQGNTIQAANSSHSATNNKEIKTVQNAAYVKTHDHATELGHNSGTSADASPYTYPYMSNGQTDCDIGMASNIAYLRSHHHHPLDVIYEERQPDSVRGLTRQDRTYAEHSSNLNAHTKSETML